MHFDSVQVEVEAGSQILHVESVAEDKIVRARNARVQAMTPERLAELPPDSRVDLYRTPPQKGDSG